MNGNWTGYGYIGYIGNGKKIFAVNDTECKEMMEDAIEIAAEIGDEPEFDFEKFKLECSKIMED